jgi:Fe-S cluster assembly protein SufD
LLQGDAASGYRISLAGQTCLVTQPVELRFVTTPETKAREISVAIKIEIGGNGRLTLLERHGLVAGAPVAHMQDMEITLAPQAKLVHGKIVAGGAVAHLAKTKVMVEAGAYYNNFSLITGGRPTRNELTVDLKGAEAQAGLNGAMLLRASDHADTLTQLTHQAPFGTSRQVYKTVLDDRAHGVFQGKIHVAEGAQKTDGYQLSRALLLSDQAEMDAKPELEIYADDVKCSHGSTVGDLDADAMFYLRTRGLSESQARGLLIQGFVGEILDEIAAPEWRALFQHEVEGWLNERA